jgi:hypothetical protein
LLAGNHVRYCVIDDQGVNAYVDPLVSLDLDLVVAIDPIHAAEELVRSIDLASGGSKLRVQIQIDPRYSSFVERARPAKVLGLSLPVAMIDDILQGKIWAVQDSTRRASKRRKDLLDIERIVDAYPDLRIQVPSVILDRLQSP